MKKTIIFFALSFIFCFPSFSQQDNYIWIDRNGNELNLTGDYSDEEYDGVILYRKNGKYGFKNAAEQVKVEARYDQAENVGRGFAAFRYSTSEAWFLFDINGKMVHGSPFQKIHSINGDDKPYFYDGLLPIQSISTGKIGCLDSTGHIIIPEVYDYIKDEGDPTLYIGKDGQHGLMNRKTKEVLLTKYDKINEFSQGLAAVSKKGKWGYIDYEGKEVIPVSFRSAGYFFNNQAIVTSDEKTPAKKIINLKGEFIDNTTTPMNLQVTQVYEGVMFVRNEKQQTALFDRFSGKALTGFQYINNPVFINDYASCIDVNSSAVLLNTKGKEIIKGHDGLGSVNEGLIAAYKKETIKDGSGKSLTVEKSGYLDTSGNIIIPFNYGGTSFFKNGIAKVIVYEDYIAEIAGSKNKK